MTSRNSCPECGNTLSVRTKRCTCGWRKTEQQEAPRADHRCRYMVGERRCLLPGTISPNTHGSVTWYCRRHYHTLDDPRLGEAELRYIEENYQQILKDEYTDWRRDLFKNKL
jgi:hypothetical protein